MRKGKRFFQKIYHFLRYNKKKKITIRIAILLTYFECLIRIRPQSKLKKSYGEEKRESAEDDTYEHVMYAYWLGRRVERIGNKLPWKVKCFARALTAQKLLSEQGIHSTLYLGVRREDYGHSAHAWLRCGHAFVTGGDGTASGHVIVTKFYK